MFASKLKKIIIFLLICWTITILFANVFSQQYKVSKEILIEKTYNPLTSHGYEELATNAALYYLKSKGKFLIQLCTDLPFLSAHRFANAPFNTLALAFERRGIPDNRIFISRSSKCIEQKFDKISSEIWWYPNEKDFPQTDEFFNLCQIKLSIIEIQLTTKGYYNSLNNLKKKLNSSKNQNQIIVVVSQYWEKPTGKMIRKLNIARKLLRNEIKNGSVIIREIKVPHTDLYSKNSLSDFPVISFTELLTQCN